MPTLESDDVTRLLLAWSNGDQAALNRLIPLVYAELHRLAARFMSRERGDHTLQTTALVNEAYCKLIDQRNVHWQNRTHFFAIAARLMRRILVDHARKNERLRRGGGMLRITLKEVLPKSEAGDFEILLINDALTRLAQLDERKSRIVEMKFFGGLTIEEIGEVEQLSVRTIEREWRKAKTWLHHEITVKKVNESRAMETHRRNN